MSCNSCTPAIVACCSEQLIVGTVPNILNSYWVVIEDITNGRKIILNTTLNGTNLVVDISEQNFAENHSYQLNLCEVDELTPISWYIESTMVNCLQIRFNKYFDTLGNPIIIDPQTISL